MIARESLSLSPLQSDPISTSLTTGLVNETASSNDDGLPQQVEILKSRQAFLWKSLNILLIDILVLLSWKNVLLIPNTTVLTA
jgi:hypothetical protein